MKQYIDKSALVAEIERIKKEDYYDIHDEYDGFVRNALDKVLSFLNTLEVKRADLDNDYAEEIYSHLDSIKDTADRMTSGNFMHNRAAIKFSANTIAKVLELMGIKAQK